MSGHSNLADPYARALGYINWNVSPHQCSTSDTPTSQTVYVNSIWLPYWTPVSNIILNIKTAASGTATGFFVGLAGPTGTMVAQSANLGSAFPSGTGPKAFALSAAYIPNPADSSSGLYFVVLLQNGAFSTTNPIFFGADGGPGVAPALGSSPILFGTGGTTGQTALPANGSGIVGGLTTTNGLAFGVGCN